jgi:hypothetical protein
VRRLFERTAEGKVQRFDLPSQILSQHGNVQKRFGRSLPFPVFAMRC